MLMRLQRHKMVKGCGKASTNEEAAEAADHQKEQPAIKSEVEKLDSLDISI